MNLSRKNILPLFLAALSLFPVQVFADVKDTPPFFKVHLNGNTMYLLGSVHVGKADFYPLTPTIQQHFNKSNTLIVEAIPSKNDTKLLTQYTDMPAKDKKIDKLLKQYCEDKIQFCKVIENLPPWLQAAQITLFRLSGKGFSPQFGIDAYFLKNAQHKQIEQLESMEYQFSLLNSLSSDTQWAMVIEAIKGEDSKLSNMFNLWRNGDLNGLALLTESELTQNGNDELIDKMLWQRNRSMSDKLIELLSEKNQQNSFFVVVGAVHLVGQNSINQFLKQQGAEVMYCWPNLCEQ
ncbi:TraB/GumN family protein [Parashewanella spongiae]|uniref:TraB/GumN family protein n=1 Tax=Parashewanella spongiae TaxID=342950 RepID=A0A3A6TPH8_9GAMM|nr:TraB/GumN family protein [Parashewanella spongiae]MCL1078878.1 TraB/GumN family protein [Parashewanella spongiae]RJY17850.1 TraB/GumN family protein [Parashewanella spongiae]